MRCYKANVQYESTDLSYEPFTYRYFIAAESMEKALKQLNKYFDSLVKEPRYAKTVISIVSIKEKTGKMVV